jgi:para-nitrobenzyl esterase
MARIRYLTLSGVPLAVGTLVGVAAGSATADDSAVRRSDGPIVRTADGSVRGTVAADHRTFQAIPYAAPPVGALRWRAPQPAAPWSGVRDATQAGSPCPQMGADGPDQPLRPTGSEDCLYLNIDTPRPATSRPLPVMVFLHGGGFVGGSGAPYDPTRITTQGHVVFVTLNYRLGALGFLDHSALKDRYAGNFGLADQQAALQWVRRNIAAFGGDPGNVTLWGESAGAFSTCAQLAAPGARGLFHKAIVQSGPCGNAMLTPQVAQQRGLATASKLGCTDSQTAAACLRAKPFLDLVGLDEDQVHMPHRYITGLPWLPVAGTPALPLQPLTALQHGLAANVPLIHGGTKDEMRLFVAEAYDGQKHPVTAAEYPRILQTMFGPKDAQAILAQYPLSRYPTPSLALATLLSDDGHMIGACGQLPGDEAVARRSTVYAYDFVEPSNEVINGFPIGAHHGVDVPNFFDSRFPGAKPPVRTPAEKAFADKLVSYWTTFARTGNPGPDWPAYHHGSALSLSIGRIGPVDLARDHQCRFWESRY